MQNTAWGKSGRVCWASANQERSRPRLLPRLPWEKDLEALIPPMLFKHFFNLYGSCLLWKEKQIHQSGGQGGGEGCFAFVCVCVIDPHGASMIC